MSEITGAPQIAELEPPAGDWSQADRLLAIDTSLGKDRLLLTSLSGDEAISQLFTYDVEMLSLDHSIAAESLVGHKAGITITTQGGQPRLLHGVIAQLRVGPLMTYQLRSYAARVVPWLWFLGHTTDCRIYQNMSVPDIIEQVFSIHGYSDFEMSISRSDYPKLEFCVQYRESALNFVSRLKEQVGIFYFFWHEKDRHVLVLADTNSRFQNLPEPHLSYGSNTASGASIMGWELQVTRWEHTFGFRPGQWTQKDFNFETPSGDLRTTEKTLLKLRGANNLERYDYPGGYTDKALGGKLTRTLMEAEEAAFHTVLGASNYSQLCVGGKFTLEKHPVEDDRTPFVIRRIRHEAVENSYLRSTEPSHYENKFDAIPHGTRFRPARITEKPFVHGPQTAMVVGPAGEKIYTDKFGRVRVQFHWDRYGKHDERSSCWIRVSQSWAGRGWGAVNLPHVGHEVVVSFLEGDPDRPLVTGRVYNGESGTAMGMPDNKTQSAMRDHSGNEIVMEGKSGSEDIRINATKDTNVVITHDYNETVKTGNRTISVQAGTHTETIKGDTKVTVSTGTYEHGVAANTAHRVAKNAHTIESTAANVLVQAKTEIKLLVGASSITMTSDGKITILGKNIQITGSESVNTKGGAVRSQADQEHEIKGSIVVSEGSVTNTVKGTMVMLNPDS